MLLSLKAERAKREEKKKPNNARKRYLDLALNYYNELT